jgi:glycosyltransferase involved in cell wall biosynthesis
MRVLALTNLYPNPLQPGRGPYNRLIFRFLAEQAALRVVAPVAWTDYLLGRWKHGKAFPPYATLAQDQVPVTYPLYFFPPKCLRAWYGHCLDWSIQATLDRAIADFAPDLLYASWAYPDGWAAVHCAARHQLPVVVSVLGSDLLMVRPHSRRHQRMMEGLRRADAVVTVSGHLAERALAHGVAPERLRVICTGVDPNVFCYGPPDAARSRLGLHGADPIIVAIGNLVPVKGFENLIDACATLAKAGQAFRCFIIGQGPLRGKLQQRIVSLKLTEQVRLVGALPQERLPDWYRAADVVAIPSYSEGVPNVQLEAAACGTPYVASQVGGIPEFIHLGRGQLVPPGDVPALAQALRARLNDLTPRTPPAPSDTRKITDVVAELLELFEEVRQARGWQSVGTVLTEESHA